ncbi:MAG: XcyI family restriction endonuclease [Chloroflexi bacterium]|nr:XcyI family restriction endonuclease [Chloroflexota bacterium]
MTIDRFEAELQISLAQRLLEIDQQHLAPALEEAVGQLDITKLDAELARLVPAERLGRVSAVGLRGERLFPVPLVLLQNPRLLAYYRLLYGISQKSFYRTLGRFRSMEEQGRVSDRALPDMEALCASLCGTGWDLFEGIGSASAQRIRDLQVMTLGSQWRGGYLNRIGQAATRAVFKRIRAAIADSAVEEESGTHLLVRNASDRLVRVSFSADPDIAIAEKLTEGFESRLAIEIKGGTDVSNIHNRIGEAEKSHQKAQAEGFREFWTIINAPISHDVARRDSPTTQEFFQLGAIKDPTTSDWVRFRDQLTSRLGIPAAS